MSNNELTKEQIQQLLDENTQLIKVILTCQNEGRIMDAMLYQTRFQLNLTQLAACADNHKHPSLNTVPQDSKTHSQITKFVRAVETGGFKDLNSIADQCDIPVDKIGQIGIAYIAFLRRQSKFTEAKNLENELIAQGFQINGEN